MKRFPPHTRAQAAAAALLAVAAAATCLASCGDAPTVTGDATPPPTTIVTSIRLHLLVGTAGAMRFISASASGETSTALPDAIALPGSTGQTGNLQWASGDPDSGFILCAGPRGRLFVTEPSTAAPGPAWREVLPHDVAGTPLHGPISFAVPSPDGRRIAALVGTPASGVADARLLLIDRSTGATRTIPLKGIVDGRPPTWIGPETVAIPVRDPTDAHLVALADVSAGSVVVRPADVGPVAASGDGATVVAAGSGMIDAIATGTATAFMAGGGSGDVPFDTGAHRAAAQVLLDRTGSFLAVAWLDDGGDTAAVGVYRRERSVWTHVFDVPWPHDATRAVLVGFSP